jgi:trehalose 6-phosphate synthase
MMGRRADLILANRAYLDHGAPPGDGPQAVAAAGGLLAAVRAAIAPWDGHEGTAWIGAGRGAFDHHFTDANGCELIETPTGPLNHRRLSFDATAWRGHYAESANRFTWPLFHLVRVPLHERVRYYPRPVTPSPAAWAAHVGVNRRFAEAALTAGAGRSCWVQDYQLALVPRLLRQLGYGGRIGFFLHTPFPGLGLARAALDEAGFSRFRELLHGMLGADVIGFQTSADRDRFMEAATVEAGAAERGDVLEVDGRQVIAGAYPVGIDPAEVERAGAAARLPAAVASAAAGNLPIVAGLERCDFTKGIPERLGSVERAFAAGHEFAYAGIAAPTRAGVGSYDSLDGAITAAASQASAAAAALGVPFAQLKQSLSWDEVVALQRQARVIFTSSLADGMNLVPLQAAIAQAHQPASERAVLLAGRDAGVAQVYRGFEDDGLHTVDPLDPDSMMGALTRALRRELAPASDRLIAAIRANDARHWAERFLTDLEVHPC